MGSGAHQPFWARTSCASVSPRWVGIVSEDPSSAKSPAPNLSLSRTQFKTKQDPFPFPFPRFRGDSDLKGGSAWYGEHGGVSAGTAGGNPAEQRPIRVFSASGPGRKDQDWARRPQEKLSKAPRGGAWTPVRLAAGGKSVARFFKAWGLPLTLGIPRTCPSGSGGLVWGSLHSRPWGLWLVLEPFWASVSPSVK